MCDPDRVAIARIEHFRRIIEHHRSRSPRLNRAGAMDAWRGLEETLTGVLDGFRAPAVSEAVGRWVESGEGCAC